MRKDTLTNAFLIAAFVAANSACDTIYTSPVKSSENTNTPKTFVPTGISPSFTPTESPYNIPTTKPTEVISPTPESPFIFDRINLGTTGFTIQTTPELQKLFGHIYPYSPRTVTGDIPMPVTIPWFSAVEQSDIFEHAASDTSKGNPYYVYRTDLPNHYILYFHSRLPKSPGDLSREASAYVLKGGDEMNLITQPLEMSFGGIPVQAEIVDVRSVSDAFFMDSNNWSVGNDNMIFARTDNLGVPDRIRTDQSPNVLYLTITGCQSSTGNVEVDLLHPDQAYNANGVNVSIMTIKVRFP